MKKNLLSGIIGFSASAVLFLAALGIAGSETERLKHRIQEDSERIRAIEIRLDEKQERADTIIVQATMLPPHIKIYNDIQK